MGVMVEKVASINEPDDVKTYFLSNNLNWNRDIEE
jgi:hypothetical protein